MIKVLVWVSVREHVGVLIKKKDLEERLPVIFFHPRKLRIALHVLYSPIEFLRGDFLYIFC